MNFPMDHIALEQARVLGGLRHRCPEDNYSFEMFCPVSLLDLSRSLSGEVADFGFTQGSGELDPLHAVRVRLDNVIGRL